MLKDNRPSELKCLQCETGVMEYDSCWGMYICYDCLYNKEKKNKKGNKIKEIVMAYESLKNLEGSALIDALDELWDRWHVL